MVYLILTLAAGICAGRLLSRFRFLKHTGATVSVIICLMLFVMGVKIGADEKMINRALFRQIGIFFFIPLVLAVVHSVFGMIFIKIGLQSMGRIDYFSSILSAAMIFILIYGAYFFLTYFGSKRIIRNS